MIHNHFYHVRHLWIGIVLSLLTLFYGFGLGAAFGVAEDGIKESLKKSAQANEAVYNGDNAGMSKVTEKAWIYFKRAHFHATGMGAASLAMIIFLSLIKQQGTITSMVTATGLGAGAMGYSAFWMLAGIKAPVLGSTGLAKESLAWLAIPSGGMFIFGTIVVIVIFAWGMLGPPSSEKEGSEYSKPTF
ncbi:MAG: hypothetical protein HRF42_04005 [Candidatus Brocadia sp.]